MSEPFLIERLPLASEMWNWRLGSKYGPRYHLVLVLYRVCILLPSPYLLKTFVVYAVQSLFFQINHECWVLLRLFHFPRNDETTSGMLTPLIQRYSWRNQCISSTDVCEWAWQSPSWTFDSLIVTKTSEHASRFLFKLYLIFFCSD